MQFDERLNAVPWSQYGTAYGPAVKVPGQLKRLASPNHTEAMEASHELWCGLCHQHVQVGCAASPALPFILEVLDTANRDLTVELLDILLGFAIGVSRKRTVEFHRAVGRGDPAADPTWVLNLRSALNRQLPRFASLATSPDAEVANFAACIVRELATDGPAA
jgi:hypothetical protein